MRSNFKAALEKGEEWNGGQWTRNTCKRLLRDEPTRWRFLKKPDVPPINNTEERALRPYVVWRKTRFFSQSERGNSFRARILSVTETCKRLGVSAYGIRRQACEQGRRQEEITVRLPFGRPSLALISGTA